MPKQRMGPDSLDKIVNDNQTALLRRRSMPQGFASNMQNRGRRMSKNVGGDMMTFGNVNKGIGGYGLTQPPSAAFPSVNTNVDIQDQPGDYMDYSQVSPDLMGGMIPNQFSGMNLGIGNDVNQMNMFSATGQYPYMAPNYFSMDMTNSAPISATPSKAPTGMGGDDQVKEELMQPRYNTMDSTHSAHTQGMNVDPNMGSYAPAIPTLQHQPWSAASFSPAKTHLRRA